MYDSQVICAQLIIQRREFDHVNTGHRMRYATGCLIKGFPTEEVQRKTSVFRQGSSTSDGAGHWKDAGAPTHEQEQQTLHVSVDMSISLWI